MDRTKCPTPVLPQLLPNFHNPLKIFACLKTFACVSLGINKDVCGGWVGIVVVVCGKIETLHYGRLGVVGILDHYNLISANWLIKMFTDFQHKYLSP